MIQPVNSIPIILNRARFITAGIPGTDEGSGYTESARGEGSRRPGCGLEPTQCAASLEVPLWMLEVTSCSTMREAEDPRVDCASLQALKTLLHNSVLKDRHPIAGGADANPHESNPTCTTGVVSPSVAGDPLAQVAAGNPTASGDVAVEVASRTRANPASPRRGEGGRP
jgi:hypothetical protein